MGSQCSEQGLVTREWRNEKIAWLAQVSCSWSFIVWILWHTFMTFHYSMKIFFKSDFTVSVLKSFSNNVASKTIYWKRKMLILIQHDWSIRNPYLQTDLYQNPSSFVMNHKLLAFYWEHFSVQIMHEVCQSNSIFESIRALLFYFRSVLAVQANFQFVILHSRISVIIKMYDKELIKHNR